MDEKMIFIITVCPSCGAKIITQKSGRENAICGGCGQLIYIDEDKECNEKNVMN